MTKWNNVVRIVGRSPVLWGIIASAGFYGLIELGMLKGDFVGRYFLAHPILGVEVGMFFIGMAALLLKLLDVAGQYPRLAEPLLGPKLRGGQTAENFDALLARLDRLPQARQGDYLVRRLRETLEHLRRHGSADSLFDQLKYLAEVDAERVHTSHALVRVVIWAIPILGFLGTVVGITIAIANLAPDALENSLPAVTAGLGVAFDTTALALTLSMMLMFTQFGIDRAESSLLAQVDQRANDELEGRFQQLPTGPDGHLLAVQRMAEAVVQASEQLVQRQAELWTRSMEAASVRWTQMANAGAERLQTGLTAALAKGLDVHAQRLTADERSVAEQNRQQWSQLQQTQTRQTEALVSLQAGMAAQAEMLARAVEAAGRVTKLEDALNRNLASLAGAKNFEQTVMSLAAVIHLLNARLAGGPSDVPAVKLEVNPRSVQAA